MASFDVTSLLTNVPLDETVDIISNCVFANAVRFMVLIKMNLGNYFASILKIVIFFLMGFYTNRSMASLWVHP